MKVIDLLNRISKGEEVPQTIKYADCEWFWCESCKIYETGEMERNNLYKHFGIEGNLNDEVEIIEDEVEIIEDEVEILDEEDEFIDIEEITSVENSPKEFYNFSKKINDLIKNQKKIIERVDK